MPRPSQLKRQLQRLVAEKRRRDEAKNPCTSCGKPLFDPMGRLYIRLIGSSEQPCSVCEEKAANIAPDKQLHVQIPFARKDLDEAAEQWAGGLGFIRACLFDYGMTLPEIRSRYAEHYPDLDNLLAELDSDGPPEAA